MEKKFLRTTAALAIFAASQLGPYGTMATNAMDLEEEINRERLKSTIEEHYRYDEWRRKYPAVNKDAWEEPLIRYGHTVDSSPGFSKTFYILSWAKDCKLCNHTKNLLSQDKK